MIWCIALNGQAYVETFTLMGHEVEGRWWTIPHGADRGHRCFTLYDRAGSAVHGCNINDLSRSCQPRATQERPCADDIAVVPLSRRFTSIIEPQTSARHTTREVSRRKSRAPVEQCRSFSVQVRTALPHKLVHVYVQLTLWTAGYDHTIRFAPRNTPPSCSQN